MAQKRSGAKRTRETLASKLGVSARRLSRKIELVQREDPSLTPRQAAGKAAGILRNVGKKPRGRKRRG